MNSLANERSLIDYGESISQPATGSSERHFVNAPLVKMVQRVEVFRTDLVTIEKHLMLMPVPLTLCRSDHSEHCEVECMHVPVVNVRLGGDFMASPSSLPRYVEAHVEDRRLRFTN